MNKTYIKRQLTLHELGIPISKDIKELIVILDSVFETKCLTKEHGILDNVEGYLYFINKKPIVFFMDNFTTFWLSNNVYFTLSFNSILPDMKSLDTFITLYIMSKFKVKMSNLYVQIFNNDDIKDFEKL